jgi:hypothetical protein
MLITAHSLASAQLLNRGGKRRSDCHFEKKIHVLIDIDVLKEYQSNYFYVCETILCTYVVMHHPSMIQRDKNGELQESDTKRVAMLLSLVTSVGLFQFRIPEVQFCKYHLQIANLTQNLCCDERLFSCCGSSRWCSLQNFKYWR